MTDTTRLTNPISLDEATVIRDSGYLTPLEARLSAALVATMQQEAEYLSIFRRCVDIIEFHSGDDSEKVEAIRRTMLQAPHLTGHPSEYRETMSKED